MGKINHIRSRKRSFQIIGRCRKIGFQQQYSFVFCDDRRWNVMTEYCYAENIGWNLIAAKEAFLI